MINKLGSEPHGERMVGVGNEIAMRAKAAFLAISLNAPRHGREAP